MSRADNMPKIVDSLIRKYYATGGSAAVIAALNKRSRTNYQDIKARKIRNRAARIGVNRLTHQPWSDEELAALRRTYPKTGAEGHKEAYPGRTLKAIRGKAQSLGIRQKRKARIRQRLFDSVELGAIRLHYADGGAEKVIESLSDYWRDNKFSPRRAESIALRANLNGLYRRQSVNVTSNLLSYARPAGIDDLLGVSE